MADKSPHKSTAKKPGKTLKEKRAAKKLKHNTTAASPLDAINHRDRH